jgi:diketogulonate reductase-like aldo/keto reductase
MALSEFRKETGLPRNHFTIVTKVLPHISNIPEALEKSIERLGPAIEGYVDLYLIHAPFWDVMGTGVTVRKAWEWMEEAVGKGLALSIGVSNFRVSDLQELESFAKIKPVVNQVFNSSD